MNIASKNKPVQTIFNQIKRGNIVLTHKLQRREGAWNKQQKSLLVDSLLRGYAVNPTYTVIEDNIHSVIDGVQRFSTLVGFMNDEFSLSKNLQPVKIGNDSYEIAGKKFSKLDDPVKDELSSAQIQVYEITEYTDKDIREMFRRLNSGKPLNTVQKMTPDMSDELCAAVSSIIEHPFFEKVLTGAQLKSSVDMAIALEVLMLSEMSNEYDFGSFSRTDREKFIQYYNDKVNADKNSIIIQSLDKLDGAFDEDVKIPKTSISMIIYGMYRILKDNKSTEKYIAAVKDFLENYDSNEAYIKFTKEGTSHAENVKGRLDYFRNMVKNI